MDPSVSGHSDISFERAKITSSSSPVIYNQGKHNSRLMHQNVGFSMRHSIERSVPPQDTKFLTSQMLAGPGVNHTVCKSAENLYIPNTEINREKEILITTQNNDHAKEEFPRSPTRPFKRVSSSSSAASFSSSANPTSAHLSAMPCSSSVYTDGQNLLPESCVAYSQIDNRNLTPDRDTYYEQTALENGDSQQGSSSPRLSPMINMPHISGDSSDERHEKSENDHFALHEELAFERSVSWQDRTFDSETNERHDMLRPSDSSRSLDSSRLLESSQNSQQSSGKDHRDRKESRESKSGEKDKKNRKAWYNVLNPTYKSRSEDLKRLFPDLPSDERLIVDYSCALQKDILVHGRLYVTSNYFCFYSKIFGWETCLCIKCKEIVSMTKEKTALVIPNALQINTESDKHFFTSFTAREKTYLMLFRIWQNALMDQQMSPTELWQYVHSSYGDELGLTSDDDDYVAPSTEDDMKSTSSVPMALDQNLEGIHLKMSKIGTESADDFSQCDTTDGAALHTLPTLGADDPPYPKVSPKRSPLKNFPPMVGGGAYPSSIGHGKQSIPRDEIPTDCSGSNESDQPRDKIVSPEIVVCPAVSSHHLGREVNNFVVALPLDTVFTLLFTNSTFMLDLYAARKTYDVHASPWQSSTETNQKIRQLTYVVTLPTNSFGPKVSNVTETQVISSFSKPGEIYTVDAEACNSGIPYADSFFVSNHWCLTRESATHTRISVWSQVKYKKNVWGFMKNLIDKNAFNGLENLMNDIHTALLLEVDKTSQKKPRRRRRRIGSKSYDHPDSIHSNMPNDKGKDIHKSTQIPQRKMTFSALPTISMDSPSNATESASRLPVFILCILLLLNAFLYHRLWALEAKIGQGGSYSSTGFYLDPSIFKLSGTSDETPIEEWVQILHHQEVLHSSEVERWRKAVSEAADYLRKAEESLRNLHTSIPHSQASKLQSLLRHLEVLQQVKSQGGGGDDPQKKSQGGEEATASTGEL